MVYIIKLQRNTIPSNISLDIQNGRMITTEYVLEIILENTMTTIILY